MFRATFIIALCIALPVKAEFGDEGARELSTKALNLLQAGNYNQSVRLVDQGLSQCLDSNCRSRLSYTLGYLHERQSAHVPYPEAISLLEQAVACYASVLEQTPQHTATVINLVRIYSWLGDEKSPEVLLRSALDGNAMDQGDRRQRATFALALGDFYLRQERYLEGVEAYRVAVDAMPARSAPKRREIHASEGLITHVADELLVRLQSWAVDSPEAAQLGYEMMLAKALEIGPEKAETALLNWLDLTRSTLGAAPVDIRRLSSDWGPISELHAFVQEPSANYFSVWWFEDPKRTEALVEFVSRYS